MGRWVGGMNEWGVGRNMGGMWIGRWLGGWVVGWVGERVSVWGGWVGEKEEAC